MKKDILHTCMKFGFIGLFIFQFLSIIYINLFQNGLHLGFDAAPTYTNAIEMWEQGTFYPDVRRNFSNLHLDTVMPFAALLYGLTGNIFISFGIVNIIFSSLIAFMFVLILKDMTKSRDILVIVVPLCILFTPYINPGFSNANPLTDFYSLLYASAAFWGFRLLTGLFIIKIFYDFFTLKSISAIKLAAAGLVTLIVFINAFSSGFYVLVTFIAPLLLFLAYKFISDGITFKELFKNRSVYLVLLWVVTVFAGRFVCRYFFEFYSNDSPMLVGAFSFFVNLQSIYLGLLDLFAAITIFEPVRVMSVNGIGILANFFVVHLLIVAFIIAAVRLFRKRTTLSDTALILLAVIITNLLIFILTHTRYGSPIFESRYLVPIAAALIAILAVFLASFEIDIKPSKSSKKVYRTGLLCVLAVLIFSNAYSFRVYSGTTIEDQKVMAQDLSSFDVKLAYVPDTVIFNNLRVLNTNMIFHYVSFENNHFQGVKQGTVGGYKHYLMPGEYRGETLLLVDTYAHEGLPQLIRDKYVYQGPSGFHDWNVYKADDNYLNLPIGDYISFMSDQEHVIILSVKDCGSLYMDEGTQNGLYTLGLQKSLVGATGNSYAAIIDGYDVVFEEISIEQISYSFEVNYFLIELVSAGAFAGNHSSILIDFEEFSTNREGINIVVFNKVTGKVIDAVRYDMQDPFRMMMR